MRLKVNRILVIDDDEVDRMRIRRLLMESKLRNFPQIDAFTDWDSGREALLSRKYDCVLLDYRPPGIDGNRILNSLRSENHESPPIIMETVHDDEETGLKAIEAGAQDYLVKGKFDSEVLYRAICYACERHKLFLAKERTLSELKDALSKVKSLEGILPICMTCKKIRNDRGYWDAVEEYVTVHTSAQFSHGLCPVCAKKYMESEGMDDEAKLNV